MTEHLQDTQDTAVWYIAVVNNHSEQLIAKALERLGYEAFVPSQKEERFHRDGQSYLVDRLVLPAKVLVKCTEKQRLSEIVRLPYIKRCMVDLARTKADGCHQVATIADWEVRSFRQFLSTVDKPIDLQSTPLHLGEHVRVCRGRFKGLEGKIRRLPNGRAEVVITLGVLGCSSVVIGASSLTIVKE